MEETHTKRNRNFEYIESLPDSCVKFEEYKGYKFDRYWFDTSNDEFYIKCSHGFKKVATRERFPKYKSLILTDTEDCNHTFGLKTLLETLHV